MAVIVITAILGFLVDVIPDLFISQELIQQGIFSPTVMVIGFIAMIALFLVPVVGGALGGFLISKKSNELLPTLVLPAVGTAIAGIIMIGIPAIFLLALDDSGWQGQLDEIGEALGEDMAIFKDMTVDEFKSFTMLSLGLGMVFTAIMNFAFGLIGGFLGRWLNLRSF